MADAATQKDQLIAARADVLKLLDETNCAPILVRLAWHDSGTFDATVNAAWPRAGGANASIRFEPEILHGANAGLRGALTLLEPIKAKYPLVSWADLMQMGSALAVEFTGGPKIPMRYGRVDVASAEECAKEGNLPAAAAPFPAGEATPAQHLRNVFHRMGLNDQEIVALSGAHTLGRAHKNRSGFGQESTKYTTSEHVARHDGKPGNGRTAGGSAWTDKWLKFDNSYFVNLRGAAADPELLKLPTDACLFEDEAFRPHADRYADSQEAFFAEYAAAHNKLSELGSKFEPADGITLD